MTNLAASTSRRELVYLTLFGVVAFLVFWYLVVATGVTPRRFLPAPHDVLSELIRLTSEPFAGHTLGEHLLSSFHRFLLGFLIAIAVGIPLGLMMAMSSVVRAIVNPIFEAIRFVAPIAWVPFAALWFGTGVGGPLLVIFMGAFPPVLINTYRGAIYVDQKYIEAARMLGAGHFRVMAQVMLPASIPSIVAGLRISAGLGWQSLVGAELIVAASGVGYMMVKGQASIQTSTVMAGMIAIGLVGLLIDVILRRAEAYLNRYKESR